jgi:tRNA A22 N-methylase
MRATTDAELNADRDTRGPPLSESTSSGKDRAPSQPPGSVRDDARGERESRIGAVIAAATRLLPEGGLLVEVGFDHGKILFGALAARPDARGLGIEVLPEADHPRIPPELAARCRLVTGDGLDLLADTPEAASTVVIMAGLGARSIAALLARHPTLVTRLCAVVLCPTFLEAELRPALRVLGLGLADERLAFDRDRYYEVITARAAHLVPASASDLDPMLAAWGPRLFDQRDPLFPAFLRDARTRLAAAFARDLEAYADGPKAALGQKLAGLDALLRRLETPRPS